MAVSEAGRAAAVRKAPEGKRAPLPPVLETEKEEEPWELRVFNRADRVLEKLWPWFVGAAVLYIAAHLVAALF